MVPGGAPIRHRHTRGRPQGAVSLRHSTVASIPGPPRGINLEGEIAASARFRVPKHLFEARSGGNTPGKYSFIRGNSGNAIRPRSLAGDVVSCWCAPACAYGWRIGRATLGCPEGRKTAIPLLSVSVPKRRRPPLPNFAGNHPALVQGSELEVDERRGPR